jgi:hypothetical protein
MTMMKSSTTICFVAGALLLLIAQAAETNSPVFKAADPWAPHPKAAPITEKRGGVFALDANGTRTCSGGWQWRFDGIVPGQNYEITTEVSHEGLAVPRDALWCIAVWGTPSPNEERVNAIWEYLLPESLDAGCVRFSRRVVAPKDASELTLRATLRWTASGKTLWQLPRVAVADSPVVKRPPARVCVVAGHHTQRRGRQFKTLQDNIEFYGQLCEAACQRNLGASR